MSELMRRVRGRSGSFGSGRLVKAMTALAQYGIELRRSNIIGQSQPCATSLMFAYKYGFVGLFGVDVDAMAVDTDIPVARQRAAYHITLFSKDEVRALVPGTRVGGSSSSVRRSGYDLATECDRFASNGNTESAKVELPADLGLGRRGDVYFKVLIWPLGDRLRRALGLPRKDFHITLSAADSHSGAGDRELDRGVASLVQQPPSAAVLALCSDAAFDRMYSDYTSHGMLDVAEAVARLYVQVHPTRPAGYIRCGDSLYATAGTDSTVHKRAMLLYAHGAVQALSDEREAVSAYCVGRICRCAQYTEFGPILTETEAQNVLTDPLVSVGRWPAKLEVAVAAKHAVNTGQHRTELLSLPSRERMSLRLPVGEQTKLYTLPRFFRWLVPFRIAIMSTPRSPEDVMALADGLNIGLIVTLAEEAPLPAAWFDDLDGAAVTNLFVPVLNYRAPTLAQVNLISARARETMNQGRAVLVHCGGGKGRAGTVAACWLARYGFSTILGRSDEHVPAMSAAEAIRALREMRPGSLETAEQERFVEHYVKHLWASGGQNEPGLRAEPSGPGLDIDGVLDLSSMSLIVLCGLPGSGKSWLAAQLLARRQGKVTLVSQDDLGSLQACEDAVASASASMKRGDLIVVDRCNPTAADRRRFTEAAQCDGGGKGGTVCVWMDYSSALCVQRAELRTGHPTLPPVRVRSAVRSFARVLVGPDRQQEGFDCVIRISSFTGVTAFLLCLAPPPAECQDLPLVAQSDVRTTAGPSHSVVVQLHKFPRTRHLLNLGEATRDDLVLTPEDAEVFLKTPRGATIIVEEKVDGANLGISIDPTTHGFRVQNRGHYVNSSTHEQFRRPDHWLAEHREALWTVLGETGLILFGEWLYARHSIHYTTLPDIFLAFDLYDPAAGRFYSRERLRHRLEGTGIHQVRQIDIGQSPHADGEAAISPDRLSELAHSPSAYYDGSVEGVYVRRDGPDWLLERAKIVRADFLTSAEHWTRARLVRNGTNTWNDLG